MSSTNKTSLGLNMWEASDKPVRQDFVNDNAIIDEKVSKLEQNFSNENVIINEKITKLNSNLTAIGNSKADKTEVHDLHGINPNGFSLLAWAADEAKRLSIWQIDNNTVADFPDGSEWCALNLQDSGGNRGIVVAFKYGGGGASAKYRCYFAKSWLGDWKTIV